MWGKLAVPEQILSKPGALTPEEYKVMQGHVEASVAIIRNLPSLDYVLPAAVTHHERWDGKGYPGAWRERRSRWAGGAWRWPTRSTQ